MSVNPSMSPGAALFSYFRGLCTVRGPHVHCLCELQVAAPWDTSKEMTLTHINLWLHQSDS